MFALKSLKLFYVRFEMKVIEHGLSIVLERKVIEIDLGIMVYFDIKLFN